MTRQEAINHERSDVMPGVKQVQHVSVCAVHEGLKLCKADIAVLIKHISFPYCSFHSIRYLQQVNKHTCVFRFFAKITVQGTSLWLGKIWQQYLYSTQQRQTG